jgi:AcrR family transcriptional regulator
MAPHSQPGTAPASSAPASSAPAATARPPAATRERILDALTLLLNEQGERSATLEAVASAAGVSKGGLLYHFSSKDALIDGLLERLTTLVMADVEVMKRAAAGPVDYLVRTSVSEGSALDLSLLAAARLAQGLHPRANSTLADIHRLWLSVIEEAVGDKAIAQAIMLISDGLYYGSALAYSTPEQSNIDDLLRVIDSLIR